MRDARRPLGRVRLVELSHRTVPDPELQGDRALAVVRQPTQACDRTAFGRVRRVLIPGRPGEPGGAARHAARERTLAEVGVVRRLVEPLGRGATRGREEHPGAGGAGSGQELEAAVGSAVGALHSTVHAGLGRLLVPLFVVHEALPRRGCGTASHSSELFLRATLYAVRAIVQNARQLRREIGPEVGRHRTSAGRATR